MLRPVTDAATPVWTIDAAKDGAHSVSDSALKDGEEKIRDFEYSMQTTDPKDSVSALFRARKVSSGTRLLISSTVYGSRQSNLAPDEKLPPPKTLELAIQVFRDAAGELPRLREINGEASELTSAQDTTESAGTTPTTLSSAWSCEFAGKNGKSGNRVVLSRSAPTDWTLTPLADSLLLRAALRPDAHNPGAYGSFIPFIWAPAPTSRLRSVRKLRWCLRWYRPAISSKAMRACTPAAINPFILAKNCGGGRNRAAAFT